MSPAEDDFVNALKVYLTETKATCLDLRIQNYSLELFESILELLQNSEVTELNLEGNDWSKGLKSLCKFLKGTKIKTLKLGNFAVSDSELVTLLDMLKDSEIVDLGSFVFVVQKNEIIDGRFFVAELFQSRLTKLNIQFGLCSRIVPRSFVDGLSSTSLTSLRFETNGRTPGVLLALFPQLQHCQIKDLDLSVNFMDDEVIKALSVHLKLSKIEKLNLGGNKISDFGLNALGDGLVGSNVTDLNLSKNEISGLNDFANYLKKTKIRFLDLSLNRIKHPHMFAFPDFLKGSLVESLDISFCLHGYEGIMVELIQSLKSTKVSKLNISGNLLTIRSFSEFAAVLKDTNLEDVDLTLNRAPYEVYDPNFSPNKSWLELSSNLSSEALSILHECLKDSRLKSIRLDGAVEKDTSSCLRFLEGTKNSSLRRITLECNVLSLDYPELFTKTLSNSTFTHLNIARSKTWFTFPTFIVNLKYTSITHLNLSSQKIYGEAVAILAANLKETKIIYLNLSNNLITSSDARILAECCPQTSIISLNLSRNRIEKDGLMFLAERLAGSFVTTLIILGNLERNDEDELKIIFPWEKRPVPKFEVFPPIEKMLYENRVKAYNLVVSFKRLFSKLKDGNINFHELIGDQNVNEFLEEYLQFYKRIVDLPAAVSVILKDESLSFSQKELVTCFDQLPRQLVEFIASWVEVDVSNLIELVARADELGLVKIVEHLLLLRPLFTIDETDEILHPYFYSLLLKYKQPLCNTAVEPTGITKIKDFFTEHSELEGAQDLINLLETVNLT